MVILNKVVYLGKILIMNSETLIKQALSLCPDFETFESDRVCIPIPKEPEVIITNSVYPSEEDKLKIIRFRKNFSNKSWEFYHKNF